MPNCHRLAVMRLKYKGYFFGKNLFRTPFGNVKEVYKYCRLCVKFHAGPKNVNPELVDFAQNSLFCSNNINHYTLCLFSRITKKGLFYRERRIVDGVI